MIKNLFITIAIFLNCAIVTAQEIPMNITITPDFGFSISTGFAQTLEIAHSGTNCKYAVTFKVFSNLTGKWGLQVSAPALTSADGKDKIEANLFNYKVFGGTETAIPAQSSNVWLPVPTAPATIYQSLEPEATFTIFFFVTPRTAQMQKTYKTKATISLITL
jgi:hypothetical protein